MKKRSATTSVKLECLKCRNPMYIARKIGKLKEKGHIKHLWCIKCKAETAHIEVESTAGHVFGIEDRIVKSTGRIENFNAKLDKSRQMKELIK